jgi:hypothetical protein
LDGVADFACAFDLLMLNGDDMRRKSFIERKAALGKLLFRSRDGIQYVEHTEGDGVEMFKAVCKLGLEENCLKETGCALSLRPVKKLDQK